MSPEEQQRAIADACGQLDRWVLKKRGLYYRLKACGYTDHISEAWVVPESVADQHTYPHDEPVTKHRAPLPDYLNDLNAMHEAEKVLTAEQRAEYRRILFELPPEECESNTFATASQRAKAFLRTIGKWRDS